MRAINEIIVHCSATKEGQEVSVSEITKWHLARGFNGIGYHHIISLDGKVMVGRSVELPGAHCDGHNATSIGVCYIGGLDRLMQPKDTRTASQKIALISLLRELKQKYPAASIHGHREFSNKACPCFDAKMEYVNL